MPSFTQALGLFCPLACLLYGHAQAQSSCSSSVSTSHTTVTETETITLASHAVPSPVTTTVYLSDVAGSGGAWQPTLSRIGSAALSSITAAAQASTSTQVTTTVHVTVTVHHTTTITLSPTSATANSRASSSKSYPLYTWKPSTTSAGVTPSVKAQQASAPGSATALSSAISSSSAVSAQAGAATSLAPLRLSYSYHPRSPTLAPSVYPGSPHASANSATVAAFSNSSSLSPQVPTSTVELSSASPSATSTPSSCAGSEEDVSGNFTLTWDDEPSFSTTDPNADQFPPVFNPYHHLFFSNGYAYVPPPNEPFQPISPPQVAIFLPNASTQDIGSPSSAGARPGELGAGPRAGLSSFWFNAYSLFVGCDDAGPSNCEITIQGFLWNSTSNAEQLYTTRGVELLPCTGLKNCHLQEVNLADEGFVGLSGLQIAASVNGQPQVFFMDNLAMGWFNNTCEAVQERSMTRK